MITRLSLMSTWNPFSSLFWQELRDSNSSLATINQTLLDEMDIPAQFICPISQEILEDPVFTPYGHCYSKVYIEKWIMSHRHCPLTNTILLQNDLRVDKEATAIILAFQRERESMLNKIKISPAKLESLEAFISAYKLQVNKQIEQLAHRSKIFLVAQLREDMLAELHKIPYPFRSFYPNNLIYRPALTLQGTVCSDLTNEANLIRDARLTEFIENFHLAHLAMNLAITEMNVNTFDQVRKMFADHKKNLVRQHIIFDRLKTTLIAAAIKQRLKIDLHKTDDLKFWQEKTSFFCRQKIKHPETGKVFKIPARIKKMMQISDAEYENIHAYLQTINNARGHRTGHFSFWPKNPVTQQVYSEPQIQQLDLR